MVLNGYTGSPFPSWGLLMGSQAQSWKPGSVISSHSELPHAVILATQLRVCVCTHMCYCSVKKPLAQRALHHLFSPSLTYTNHQYRHLHIHTSSSQANKVCQQLFQACLLNMSVFHSWQQHYCVGTYTHLQSCPVGILSSCWSLWLVFKAESCDFITLCWYAVCCSQIHPREDKLVDYGKYYLCINIALYV